jgi:homogentisate 1,2-dioxygenase
MGRDGFFGPATHFYHKNQNTNWSSIEGNLRPRAFNTNNFKHNPKTPWEAKTILSNSQCQIRFWETGQSMDHLVRNADGDDILFIHEGEGDFFCDFGHLSYRDGDYLVIPRGTMWRIEPLSTTRMMMIEATGSAFLLPERGIMGPHAIFDPAILDTPKMNNRFQAQQSNEEWNIFVKKQTWKTKITFPYNPLDAIGWKGDLSVVKLNWRDIRPLMSHRYHVPPSAHTTFIANGLIVCTFCPRPIESDPGALKVPFFHDNVDYDEFIFYHKGEFFSRDNIHPGMTSFHPSGFTHGPHPKAFLAGAKATKKETDEVAVMVDTRLPLDVHAEAEHIEWKEYVHSWGGGKK